MSRESSSRDHLCVRNAWMASRPCKNSARLRHRLSVVYASATRAGSRVFHASSAMRAFCAAVSEVNGGRGGLSMGSLIEFISTAGANRRYIEAAGAAQPGVLVANDGLRRQRRGLDPHAGLLPDRGAHGEDLHQARSELDDVCLDADDFLGARRRRLALQPIEDMLARIVDEGREIA